MRGHSRKGKGVADQGQGRPARSRGKDAAEARGEGGGSCGKKRDTTGGIGVDVAVGKCHSRVALRRVEREVERNNALMDEMVKQRCDEPRVKALGA